MNISPALTQATSYQSSQPQSAKETEADSKPQQAAPANASEQASEQEAETARPVNSAQKPQSELQLTEQEQQIVEQLKSRDQEVKTHEQAHIAASSGHASSPSYKYEKGPDGRMYAQSGEVSIDTSAVQGDPQATIDKMQAVIKAANAPAQPSAQDKKVAAQAQVMLNDATQELAELQQQQQSSELESKLTADGARESDQVKTESTTSENPQQDNAASASLDQQRQQNIDSRQALERKFVDSGAFAKAFPEGSLINSLL